EAKNVDPWTGETGSTGLFDHKADPFRFDDTLAPGDRFDAGGFEWHVHAAPGHDMEALMFFEPRHRLLVSGDALWENGMGIVWPQEGANPYIEASLETLARIERLDPAVVIPGHGAPFPDVAGSLANVRSRLAAFAADPAKNARHLMKVLFVFALLEREAMPVAQVASYISQVPCYRLLAEPFMGFDADQRARHARVGLEQALVLHHGDELAQALVQLHQQEAVEADVGVEQPLEGRARHVRHAAFAQRHHVVLARLVLQQRALAEPAAAGH